MSPGGSPGAHGIFDFFRKNTPDGLHFELLTSRDVDLPARVVDGQQARPERSTVLNFPLTFPPPRIRGHVVPGGFMPWRQLRLGCHPPTLFDELKALPRFNPRELALDMTDEAKAIEGCDEEEYEAWIDMHIRRERQWVDIARYLADEGAGGRSPPSCSTASTSSSTCAGASSIRASRSCPDHRVGAPRPREVPRVFHASSIGCSASWSAMRRGHAGVVVASDHGFGPQVRTFYVNAWLRRPGGWRGSRARRRPVAAPTALGLNQMARHVYQIDWNAHGRSRRCRAATASTSCGRVTSPERRAGAAYARGRARSRRGSAPGDGPVTGERVVPGCGRATRFSHGRNLALAPDLTLELQDGGLVSILDRRSAGAAAAHPTGTHRPDGVFVASGAGFRSGLRLAPLSILDVAPLLLYTLDLPIPDARRAVRHASAPARRTSRRPARADSGTRLPHRRRAGASPALDAEAEAEILKRLQALGYVE